MMADNVPDHVQRTIQQAVAEVDRLAQELAEKRVGVNTICRLFNIPPVYQEALQPEKANLSMGRPDRYLDKPLATVVRTILSVRHEADIGPATVEDLYAEMLSGGFDFEDKSEENSKRALSVSLSKNTNVFRRLKNGTWGLVEWYGNGKPSRPRQKTSVARGAQTGSLIGDDTDDGDEANPLDGLVIDDESLVQEESATFVNKPR